MAKEAKARKSALAPDALELFGAMLALRKTDEEIRRMATEGRVSYYLSAQGDEAIYAGIAFALEDNDWLFPGAQVPDGGGLDFRCGRKLKLISAASPGGARIPHAVGAAWAAKLRKDPMVACAIFGDITGQPKSKAGPRTPKGAGN